MTTSLNVSKDLAAIGFKSNEVFFYDNRGDLYFVKEINYDKTLEIDFIAYDFQTILNALELKLSCNIKITSTDLEIINLPLFESPPPKFQFWDESIERLEGESLADTAARLLIQLVKKGIII